MFMTVFISLLFWLVSVKSINKCS